MTRWLPLALLASCAWRLGPPQVDYGDPVPLPLVHPSTDHRRWYIPIDTPVGPQLLFVDTGYSYTTCDDDLVRDLGLPVHGARVVRGELGTIRTAKAQLPPLELGGLRLDGLVCLVRDLGSTSSIDDPKEIPVAGVLGIDALRPFRAELDPGQAQIRLLDPSTVPPIRVGQTPGAVRMRRERGIGTRVQVPIEVNGGRTRPRLDTGASHTYVDGRRLGLEATWTEANVAVRGSGPNGQVVLDRVYYDVPDLQIGDHTTGPLTLTDRPRPPCAAGLLGLDVLDDFSIALDFEHRAATIAPVDRTAARPSWERWSERGLPAAGRLGQTSD